MEVIQDTSIQPRQTVLPQGTQVLSEMEKKFQELEKAKAEMMTRLAKPVSVEADETITKRNAASMLVIALNQKKQFMVIAGVSGLFILVGSIVAGVTGAFIPFALFLIFVAYSFLNNEKEIKAYKDKFGV